MITVQTKKGFIDRDLLTVTDIVTEDDNNRIIKTVWFLDGEMVREDLTISILRGQEVFGAQAAL